MASAAPSAIQAALQAALQIALEAGLATRTFPGAWAAVGNRDGILAELGVGNLDWPEAVAANAAAASAANAESSSASAAAPAAGEPWAEAVAAMSNGGSSLDPNPCPSSSTIWDVASLMKVVGTTTAALRLVEQGKLELDLPVQHYLPHWQGEGKEAVTVRMLLTHSSGLPAHRELWKKASSRSEAMSLVFSEPLERIPSSEEPERKAVYSDLGILIFGSVLEQIMEGQRLDSYLHTKVFTPLGMGNTGFLPPAPLRPLIAPTEHCAWRGGELLRGMVHDENASVLGGIAPHAGLFSTGKDMATFAQMLLREGVGAEGGRILSSPETLKWVTALGGGGSPVSGSNRAFGYEKPCSGNSAGLELETHYSRSAFGHTGFTGTSLWIEPTLGGGLFVLILSNRVNPKRPTGPEKIHAVRRAVHDSVVRIMRAQAAAAAAVAADQPSQQPQAHLA